MEDVRDWLISHDLGQYVGTILGNEIDSLEVLYAITEADLQEMGISKVGARRKFMRAVAKGMGQGPRSLLYSPGELGFPYSVIPSPKSRQEIAQALSAGFGAVLITPSSVHNPPPNSAPSQGPPDRDGPQRIPPKARRGRTGSEGPVDPLDLAGLAGDHSTEPRKGLLPAVPAPAGDGPVYAASHGDPYIDAAWQGLHGMRSQAQPRAKESPRESASDPTPGPATPESQTTHSSAQTQPPSAPNCRSGSEDFGSRPESRQLPKPPKFLDPISKNEWTDAAQCTAEAPGAELYAISVNARVEDPTTPQTGALPSPYRCPRHIERILQEWESSPETRFQHADGREHRQGSPHSPPSGPTKCSPLSPRLFASKAARDVAAQRHFVGTARKERATLEFYHREAEKLLEASYATDDGADFMDMLRGSMASSKLSTQWHHNLYGRYSPPRAKPPLIAAAPFSSDAPAGEQVYVGATSNGLPEPLERPSSRAELPPVQAHAREDGMKKKTSFKAPKEHSAQIRAKLAQGKLDYTRLLEHQSKEQDCRRKSEETYKAFLNEHFLRQETAFRNLGIVPDTPEPGNRKTDDASHQTSPYR